MKKLNGKIFLLLTILVGLAANIILIGSVTIFGTRAATPLVYFTPDSLSVPPDSSVKLMLDPAGESISFVRVRVYFDIELLRLASEISTSTSGLGQVVSVTPLSDANSAGGVEIVLSQSPGKNTPTTSFELATLHFTAGPSAGEQTDITIVDEDTELVDNNSNDLEFDTQYASVNTVPASGKFAAAANFATSIKDLLKGSCPTNESIDTAIGCVPWTDMNAMAKFFLSWGIGIAGGIALILMVYAGYTIITSQGDPKRLGAGKELLIGSIVGLLMIILSVYILRIVGVNIFQIAGF